VPVADADLDPLATVCAALGLGHTWVPVLERLRDDLSEPLPGVVASWPRPSRSPWATYESSLAASRAWALHASLTASVAGRFRPGTTSTEPAWQLLSVWPRGTTARPSWPIGTSRRGPGWSTLASHVSLTIRFLRTHSTGYGSKDSHSTRSALLWPSDYELPRPTSRKLRRGGSARTSPRSSAGHRRTIASDWPAATSQSRMAATVGRTGGGRPPLLSGPAPRPLSAAPTATPPSHG
jgi:hypothetical protein